MALKHRWHSKAMEELIETLNYVSRNFGATSVKKTFDEVFECIEKLVVFPKMGLKYSNLSYNGKEVRIFHLRKSNLIYCHDENTLFILAFWNNLRDDSAITNILEER